MKAVLVPPAKVDKAWPHVEAWVERALERGNADLSAEQIRQQCDRGGMYLWLAWGWPSSSEAVGHRSGRPVGVAVAEMFESVRGRTCNLVIVAGDDWRRWSHLLAEIERWALDWKCVRMALIGRKGWVRRLAGDGWSEKAVTLEKVIGNGQ